VERTGGRARSDPPPGPPATACARCVRPISTSRTKGTAASSASNVSALARNGMLSFVGGLQGAAEEPDGCLVPPAGSNPLQACGSRSRRRRGGARAPPPGGARAPPRRGPGGPGPERRNVAHVLEVVVLIGQRFERLLAAAELLGKLVQLLLRHGAQLPQLALEHAAGLLSTPRRVEQRQPGAEHRAQNSHLAEASPPRHEGRLRST